VAEKITSSALKSLPLWNFTPLRRVQAPGEAVSLTSQRSARLGWIARSLAAAGEALIDVAEMGVGGVSFCV
jgi:hypothetical protein